MKKHVLFVDDEPLVLQGLKRMLWSLRDEWEMFFVEDGQSALNILQQHPIEVIISDMLMPGMDGAELMKQVWQRFPHVIRIMLSGDSNQNRILRSVVPTHQFLLKPCDAETLKHTVDRAYQLQKILKNDDIAKIVNGIVRLPSVPTLYTRLLREIQSDDPSIEVIGEIIARDLTMSARILQLVNSAFFSLPNRIKNVRQAVRLLGLNNIQALVLYVNLFSGEDKIKVVKGLSLKEIWNHSMKVGTLAREILSLEPHTAEQAGDAFFMGLLHDIGLLILAQIPQYHSIFQTSEKGFESQEQLVKEYEMLRTSHAEVGAYLLGIWGLPENFVETVAFHHRPSQFEGGQNRALTALHVAESLLGSGCDGLEGIKRLDNTYIETIDLQEKLPEWSRLCLETCKMEVNNEQ
ncbi:MAG: response regulator [Desulfosporosinus sp.]|nr:response regulator [Desulfosporosinus sp.]